MLRVDQLAAGHGRATILRGVTFDVPTGTICTVIGPNGAGKTTLAHTIAGLLPTHDGGIYHHGVALHQLPAHLIARVGVALVPQGRRIFDSLTVAEHLTLAHRPGPWSIDRILDTLPALVPLLPRPGRHLSGGQQQLLAVARALARNPTLLILDEPTEGLAPSLAHTITDLITTAAAEGVTVLTTAPTLPAGGPPPAVVVRLHASHATPQPADHCPHRRTTA